MNFNNIAECKSAKNNFDHNNALSHEEFTKTLESADDKTVIGAMVIEKSPHGLWLTFGFDTRAFLEQRRSDIKRKFRFIENTEVSYINVNIISKAEDSVFFVARDTVVQSAHEFHKKNIKSGCIVTGTVVSVNDSFADIDLGAGDIACVHVSKIRDAYVDTLENYFFCGQEISLLVENWSDEFGFLLKYDGIRQPNGLKTGVVVQAQVTELLDGRKCRCTFPDYPLAEGIIVHIAKDFKLPVSATLPVSVFDIQKNVVLCKF